MIGILLYYHWYLVILGDKAAGAWRWPSTPIYRQGCWKRRAILYSHFGPS